MPSAFRRRLLSGLQGGTIAAITEGRKRPATEIASHRAALLDRRQIRNFHCDRFCDHPFIIWPYFHTFRDNWIQRAFWRGL
jgi:hypothetical protein